MSVGVNDAKTAEELYTYLDLDQSLRVFAAEAVLPFSDGTSGHRARCRRSGRPWLVHFSHTTGSGLWGYIQQRAEFLEDWLKCWEDGGKPDKKGYCKNP